MIRIILCMALLLPSFLPVMAQGDDNQFALAVINMSLNKGDTVAARTMLDKIADKCEASTNWRDRYQYNTMRGVLEMHYRRNVKSAASYYYKAYAAFPQSIAASQEFLATALDACYACYRDKQYELGEEVASDALLRASNIVDSCSHSSNLFSLLAKFYEIRGDTIMPRHFHRKAQELAIKYRIILLAPDSVQNYFSRLAANYSDLDNASKYFSKDNPEYLYLLCEYNITDLYPTGSVFEIIYLCNMILDKAKELDIPDYNGLLAETRRILEEEEAYLNSRDGL